MSTPFEEPTGNAQESRGAELEQEQSSLQEELAAGRARPRRSDRRKMLTKGLRVAAVAGVGGGVLLELSSGTAQAKGPGPGKFASSTAGTPAVKATGTSGADGVDASSDSGTGISASSTSGTGLVATSSSGLAAHFVGGNVTMDNNLTVAGTLNSGPGTFSGPAGALIVQVAGSARANTAGPFTAIIGICDGNGNGVFGQSNSGPGVFGQSSSGPAGFFDGDVQVNGNFSASGTKNFVQAHPTDPGREIVYVALEGGEAGTYVRGSGQLQSGKAVLALPEHFGLVTATEGLTVHLTPRGEWLQLYVVELDTAQLVVREAQGRSGAFDYFIYGVRRGYEQHEVIRTRL